VAQQPPPAAATGCQELEPPPLLEAARPVVLWVAGGYVVSAPRYCRLRASPPLLGAARPAAAYASLRAGVRFDGHKTAKIIIYC
jgi:hypothetical protein